MLTVLLSVLVICVHSCNSDGGRGKGAAWTRSGGSEGSGRGAAWTRSGYSGYKAKKGGSTLKKAAAIGATAFVGYQVSFRHQAAGCLCKKFQSFLSSEKQQQILPTGATRAGALMTGTGQD